MLVFDVQDKYVAHALGVAPLSSCPGVDLTPRPSEQPHSIVPFHQHFTIKPP